LQEGLSGGYKEIYLSRQQQSRQKTVIDSIQGLGGVRPSQPIKRTAKSGGASGSSFANHLDETSESSNASGVSGTSAIAGVLGVQEVDDATAHASKGKLRAQDILDRLDSLRVEILSGTISRERLLNLARLVNSQRATVTDPRLAELLDEVDLRAQVELAKYTQTNN